jgi:hypothetical protein
VGNGLRPVLIAWLVAGPDRRRQRLRADLMARNERKREQQFVLGEFAQVEHPAACQYVGFGLGVECGGPLFAFDEVEPAVDGERHRDRRQAALTREIDVRVERQPQPGMRRLPRLPAPLAARRPADAIRRVRPRRGMAGIAKARQLGQRPIAGEKAALGREVLDIEPARIVFTRFHRHSVVLPARRQ